MVVAAVAGSEAYSALNTTSSAVKGWTSCHFTSVLSFHVTDMPSAATPPFSRLGISAASTGKSSPSVLVLGTHGEVRVEQGRTLPPQHLERPAAAALGGLVLELRLRAGNAAI